jgi:hypothetical protein
MSETTVQSRQTHWVRSNETPSSKKPLRNRLSEEELRQIETKKNNLRTEISKLLSQIGIVRDIMRGKFYLQQNGSLVCYRETYMNTRMDLNKRDWENLGEVISTTAEEYLEESRIQVLSLMKRDLESTVSNMLKNWDNKSWRRLYHTQLRLEDSTMAWEENDTTREDHNVFLRELEQEEILMAKKREETKVYLENCKVRPGVSWRSLF